MNPQPSHVQLSYPTTVLQPQPEAHYQVDEDGGLRPRERHLVRLHRVDVVSVDQEVPGPEVGHLVAGDQ